MPEGNSAATETIDKNLAVAGTLAVTGAVTLSAALAALTLAIGGGSALAKYLTATGVLDFASIAAADSADLTIAVSGAAVGDTVILGLPAAPAAGLVWCAFVSATDVVTIRASNITALAVDAASATYRVSVVK